MTIQINNINVKEMWEGYKKGSGSRGPYVIKPYLVEWLYADAFVDSVLGGVSRIGNFTQYTPRHACPENPTLYATNAEINYLGETDVTGGTTPKFTQTIVMVTYSVLTWDEFNTQDPNGTMSFPNEAAPNQPILQTVQEIDAASEFITMPGTAFVFTSDNKSTDSPIGVWVGNSTLSLTKKNVPYLPQALIHAKMNKVNDATFLGQPAEQVLFLGAKTHRESLADGTRTQEVALTFKWREKKWNYAPRPDTGVWERIQTSVGGSPYETADLLPLLRL